MNALNSAIDGLLAVVRQIVDFENSRFREPTIDEDGMPDWWRHTMETMKAGIDSDDYGQRKDLRERLNLALFAVEKTAGGWNAHDLRKRLRKIVDAIVSLPGWGVGAEDEPPGFMSRLTALAESKMYDGQTLKSSDATELFKKRVQAVKDAVELLTPLRVESEPMPEGEKEKPAGGEAKPATTSTKRSTVKGEAQEKLKAALTKHHKYQDGSCLNPEHIGNNELAQMAEVSKSTASNFFKKYFKGWGTYRAICNRGDAKMLVAVLKLINDEFRPHHLLEGEPADNCEDQDEPEHTHDR